MPTLDTRGVIGPALEQANNIRQAKIKTTLAEMALQRYPADVAHEEKVRGLDIQAKTFANQQAQMGIADTETKRQRETETYERDKIERALNYGMRTLGFTNRVADYHDWYKMMTEKGVDQSWLPVPPDDLADKDYPAWRDKTLNQAATYASQLRMNEEQRRQQSQVAVEGIRTKADRERTFAQHESDLGKEASDAWRTMYYEQQPILDSTGKETGKYRWVEIVKKHPSLEEYTKQYVERGMKAFRARVDESLSGAKTTQKPGDYPLDDFLNPTR